MKVSRSNVLLKPFDSLIIWTKTFETLFKICAFFRKTIPLIININVKYIFFRVINTGIIDIIIIVVVYLELDFQIEYYF